MKHTLKELDGDIVIKNELYGIIDKVIKSVSSTNWCNIVSQKPQTAIIRHTPIQFISDIVINNVSFHYPSRPDVKVRYVR